MVPALAAYTNPLVPANAGIQNVELNTWEAIRIIDSGHRFSIWVPAFAGMSGVGVT